MIQVFGIRHHGPGSAKSLLNGLQIMQPDLILIEGPPDANQLIKHVGEEGLIPPLALLVYNPKKLKEAAYYPFATFSPEWQAMKWANEKECRVEFMDLPQSMQFALRAKIEEPGKTSTKSLKSNQATPSVRKDPLGYIAELAGFEDSERWWEYMFEQQADKENVVFEAILKLMKSLREEKLETPGKKDLQREAYMREVIRARIKDGYENIAIVCGAWHAPVLDDYASFTASEDKALLKGIKKIKTEATWVPWTYSRLSSLHGYGAGVVSPAWYELLFNKPEAVTEYWMTRAANLLRENMLDASSAHIIESVRLAKSLAALRNLPVPGVSELYESAQAVLCGGYESQMHLIREKLIIGDTFGEIPEDMPSIPLHRDLLQICKKLSLKQENKAQTIELDLRKPKHLKISKLFNRLIILNIPWGEKKRVSRGVKGSFRENWKACWEVDFTLRIIEAGLWGNTVYSASNNFLLSKAAELDNLPELTACVQAALDADLGEAIPVLVNYLHELAALSRDVEHLMDALPLMVEIIRYGDIRNTETSMVKVLVDKLIPRICISLPNACTNLGEEAAAELFLKLGRTHGAISILNNESHNKYWYETLDKMTEIKTINGLLKGFCCRTLFDKGIYDIQLTKNKMSYALSSGQEPIETAFWLEGFLDGSGLLLIHNPELWLILNEWVQQLKLEKLKEMLPLLRRTFAGFSESERKKMLKLAKQEPQDIGFERNDWNMDRARIVLSSLNKILGNR